VCECYLLLHQHLLLHHHLHVPRLLVHHHLYVLGRVGLLLLGGLHDDRARVLEGPENVGRVLFAGVSLCGIQLAERLL